MNWFNGFKHRPDQQPRRRPFARPTLEALEDRAVPAALMAEQVADIHPTGDSFPYQLTEVRDQLFFTANDGTLGEELYVSDGTSEGTRIVADIHRGDASSEPRWLTDVDGILFFTAVNTITTFGTTNGRELWQSDGTVAGTHLVADINPGPDSSNPSELINANGTLYFTAYDPINRQSLYKHTGGTTERIFSGRGQDQLTAVGNLLFFRELDRLWVSDGTPEGTRILNTGGTSLTDLRGVGDRLFFTLNTFTYGRELWTSDGTQEGTRLVKDISAGPSTSWLSNLTNVNGTLFFTADDGLASDAGFELWTSDGTEAGTRLVKDIRTSPLREESSSPDELTAVGSRLFFSANDGVHGRELWVSDGTEAGTTLVSDLSEGSLHFKPTRLTDVDGRVFFTGQLRNAPLWVSDGTEAGTIQVSFEPGVSGRPEQLTEFGGQLYFSLLPIGELWRVNESPRFDIAGRGFGEWWEASSTGSNFVNAPRGQWSSAAQWVDVQVADINGDGLADIVGRTGGDWWMARSTGTSFVNQLLGHWSNAVTWVDVQVADINGDGLADIVGRTGGDWWMARSTGTGLVNQLLGHWSNAVTWVDVQVADVNGDGLADIVGRTGGDWWMARSTGTGLVNQLLGHWSNAVPWEDIQVADVNGDGRDDVVGRTGGDWWVARSTGDTFVNELWGHWSTMVPWQDVLVGNFSDPSA